MYHPLVGLGSVRLCRKELPVHVSEGQYAVGVLVVEPFLGLCTVVALTRETILGQDQCYYQLKPALGRSTLKVPASQMASRGIRPVMQPHELDSALSQLPESLSFEEESQGDRMVRWVSCLRSGDQRATPETLRELKVRQALGHALSSKENELMATLCQSLRQEIALAYNTTAARAGARLNQAITWKAPQERKSGACKKR